MCCRAVVHAFIKERLEKERPTGGDEGRKKKAVLKRSISYPLKRLRGEGKEMVPEPPNLEIVFDEWGQLSSAHSQSNSSQLNTNPGLFIDAKGRGEDGLGLAIGKIPFRCESQPVCLTGRSAPSQ